MADIRTEFNDYRFGDIIFNALAKILERNDAKERENREEARWQQEQAFKEKDYQAKLKDYQANREYQKDMLNLQKEVTNSSLKTDEITRATQELNNALAIRKHWTRDIPAGFKGPGILGSDIEKLPGGNSNWFTNEEDAAQWYRTSDIEAYNDSLLSRAQQAAANSTTAKNNFELELLKRQDAEAQALRNEYAKGDKFGSTWMQDKINRIEGKLSTGANYFNHTLAPQLYTGNPIYDIYTREQNKPNTAVILQDTSNAFSAAEAITTEIERLMNLKVRSPQADAQMISLINDLGRTVVGPSKNQDTGEVTMDPSSGLLSQILADAQRIMPHFDGKSWTTFKQRYANLAQKYNTYVRLLGNKNK